MKKLLASIPDPALRASLGASTVDGALWALMYGFSEYFILPFAIYFGADAFQTSLVQGLGQLGVAAAQLLGAVLVLRWGRRRRLARLAVLAHAASWLAVFAAAAVTRNPWSIVLLYALGLFSTSLAAPGWLSWMNDLVPPGIRGAFWGKRNMVAGLAQFGAIAAAGLVLRLAEPRGLQLYAFGALFGLAALCRFGGALALGFQHEPPFKPHAAANPYAPLRARLRGDFGKFVLFSVLMTYAVNILGPVFPIYLLKTMRLDYGTYTAVTMVSMVLSFLAMNYWGPLSDRFGNRRILMVGAAVLPFLAFAWVFARHPAVMILIQVVAGFAWAGVNLATSNYIFDSVPANEVSGTMAGFNALSNVAAFAGSLTGGLVATALSRLDLPLLGPGNLELVFALSGALRLAVYLGLGRRFPEVRPVEASPRASHFYIYQPFSRVASRFFPDLAQRGKD